MLDKTEGIILRTTKYSETSVIAKIFTQKHGLLSFIIQGIRSSKSRQRGNLVQPLNILHLDIYLKEQRSLNRIKEYTSGHIFKSLHNDFTKQSVSIFCLELISKCIKEHEVNERLYNYLIHFLIELDEENGSIENKPLFFLLETASILGFELSFPHVDKYIYFNLESGRFEDHFTSRDSSLDAHETEILKKLLAMYYEKNEWSLAHSERKLLLDKLLLYFRWHIPDFSGLRSPDILHEILR